MLEATEKICHTNSGHMTAGEGIFNIKAGKILR